ncbi:hypothetical protein RM704_24055 [Streptomyces sp. DSM 3412]|uniref:DUF3040 domain-containing protein n=1 Tax=Streptomyces gottesmaniae TaxID=3075518 RepID=A0ABU2Z1P4_9ACTN|nr:hypothetical protein [Streptomyces sp. DSM 3412]MDT0570502.1 hypothetical protein [Streptomyces sp. DSM 3412]
MSRSQIQHAEVEQRLREALGARADSVESPHLRPAALPTRSRRSFLPPRRAVIVLFGLVAAAACALLAVTDSDSDSPVRPADIPSHSVSPSTSQAPASPVATP